MRSRARALLSRRKCASSAERIGTRCRSENSLVGLTGPRQYPLTAWSGISRDGVNTETAMKTTAVHCKRIGRATVALIALSASIAFANGPATTAANDGTIVVAQAGTTTVTRVVIEPFPAYQTGVRMAAAQGPEALRRYIWRTRM